MCMNVDGTLWRGSGPAPPHPLDELLLRDYAPRRTVVVPESVVSRPKFPVIDAHNHLGTWLTGAWSVADPGALVAIMDELDIESIINLDGRWGQELIANLDRLDRAYPGRFVTFAQVDWSLLGQEPRRGPELLASRFRESLDSGARGLKVWKDLGLTVRDDRGDLVLPDDPRLDDVFTIAGEAGVPVAIHTADPVAFFDPLDRHNERLEQLLQVPEWSFADTSFPRFAELMASLEARVARHPGTTIIGVHMGCWAENLGEVGRMLRTYPNYHVDISARVAEIGRQPRAARALIEEFPDRVLFGTDAFPPDREVYGQYFRFLESSDECYDHDLEQPSPMGRWTISALELPDLVLEAVYAGNARRLLA